MVRNCGMEIKKARFTDLDSIMSIYDRARAFMAENGNPDQWGDGYPHREDIAADITKEVCYICTEQGRICGVFALIPGEEVTYRTIENGEWRTQEPYATIHRLASDGVCSGIARLCFSWCQEQCRELGLALRIDTHADNLVMQHVIEAAGFEKCGIIRVRDGSPRIAYQKEIPR